MTPKPHPRLILLAQAALLAARQKASTPEGEQQAVSQSIGIPLVAAKFWIDMLDGKEVEIVDPQYIP